MPYEIKKVFASLPQVERGVSKIIGGDPVGNTFIYTNGKCVIIRNINFPALADIYTEPAVPQPLLRRPRPRQEGPPAPDAPPLRRVFASVHILRKL
uniref:WD repeat domain 1 n=1 Tax=Rousettus aegyptiacus TaxID=9407 RepID=A0A7J8EB97_ROUAE|nr:WD repeat domain 1 [Rousettus aegyptiacus]